MPSVDTINYKIAGFPFHENSLPGFLSKYGYGTYAFHGATGYFFGRRDSYSNMGFKRVYFKEELETILNVKSHGWGIKDKDVFQFSSNIIGEPDRKICHFIITLTSHGPYTFLLDSEKELFPDPSNLEENYLNSMRYFDRALQSYIESLPDETSVVIYGDHGAREIFTRRAKTDYREFVPFIMYTKGNAQTDGELFEFSEIDLLDSISYFRDQLGSSASSQTPHRTNSRLQD